ncbi:uncharacterized protein LOC136085710 [Hydra vulgaris]|uniref:Uncharacterized protein LOC136085710 n=1 Tax=Hydra vulgaris TaxID=6087 RepID=A0ABM4CMR7_HYDVU
MEIYIGLYLVPMISFLKISNGCDYGWFEYGKYCYFFQQKTLKGKSWSDALLSCQIMGAHLLSIEDQAENSFVKNILKDDSLNNDNYWIGLNDDCNNREFRWSDNKYSNFSNWLPKKPNNVGSGENCVETNSIGWNDNDCSIENGFICKFVKENNNSCGSGWINYNKNCYFFQNQNELFYGNDWENSYLSCLSKGGNLLSLENEEESSFVKSILNSNDSMKNQKFWIGLNYLMSHKKFVWSDHTKWSLKIPIENKLSQKSNISLLQTRCVVINVNSWNAQDCYYKYGYICKAKRESNNSCTKDWLTFAGYCYYLNTANGSNGRRWWDSYLNCLEKGGNLLSIDDETEYVFILNTIKNYNMSENNYWIGLSDRWYNSWFLWSDNTYSQYIHSKFNGLVYDAQFESCVIINKNYWEIKSHNSLNGFICKKRRAINHICNEGWTGYRKHCYFVQSTNEILGQTWLESFSLCQSKGGNLLSIENQEENGFIQNSLIKDNGDYWIGLNKLWNYRRFVWSDNTYTQFFNWIGDEPDTTYNVENCVEMNSYGWRDYECNTLNGFICKVKRVNFDYVNHHDEVIPAQGFLYGTLNVLKKEFTISFNLKPMIYSKGLKSVLQLTSSNSSVDNIKKSLGVWFHEDGSGRLVINAEANDISNCSVKTEPLTLGQWSFIKIYQWLFCSKYWFAVDLNGVNIYKMENCLTADLKEMKIYVSNIWDDAYNGSISDLLITNGKAKYLIEHYNTSLAKGKIIAKIPKINKEYLVSFDFYPKVFETGLHNIIYFVVGAHMVNNRNEVLSIWLDESGSGRIIIMALVNGKSSLYYYPIQLNMWSSIEVSQCLNGFLYVFKIRINGDVVFSIINNQAQDLNNVTIYASNPWDKVQIGLIKNFFIINDSECKPLVIHAKDYVNHKHEFTLQKGTFLGTLSVLKKEYTVSFNLKPMSYSKGLKNVLYLTFCNKSEVYDDRYLGLWFLENGSGSLVIYAAVNGKSHYFVKTDPLSLGHWHNIRIYQWLLGKKYFFTVDLNDINIHRVENSLAFDFKNIRVYGSNTWDAAQDGSISDLLIINGRVEYIIGNFITSLVKGKLIAEIPVLDKEYFVSLDFIPFKFDFGSRNVIHFTIGSDHFNYGDKTLGIWSNSQGNGVLEIASSINGYVDVHTFSTNAFEVNQWSNIVICQVFNGSFYIYTIVINEKVAFSITKNQANSFGNVKVYASNPWAEALNGSIKNLFVVNGNSTKEMKPIVIITEVSTSTSYPTNNKLSVIYVAALVPVVTVFVAVSFVIAVLRFCRKKSQKSMNLNPYTMDQYIGYDELLVDEWEIYPEDIIMDKKIGEGAFGTVFIAKLSSSVLSKKQNIKQKSDFYDILENTFDVAVKLVKDSADPSELNDFTEEMNLMKEIGYHKNIVNLIGCSTLKKPLCLIVEYMEHGDLLNYLRKMRANFCTLNIDEKSFVNFMYTQGYQQSLKTTTMITGDSSLGVRPNETPLKDNGTLTPDDLLSFAWQVASGMEYLSCSKLVHRDLAARNILVGSGKIVKISDFGLTRKTNDELNYMSKKKRRLPVKWMSVEAIFDQMFTSFSDVWAYGVVLFEIVTLGGTPYPSISNRELLSLLKTGYRMDKPENCSETMYDIMLWCWHEDPLQRPSFTTLREYFDKVISKIGCYLNFELNENTAPSFLPSEIDNNDDNTIEDGVLQNPVRVKSKEEIKKLDESILPLYNRYTSVK